MKHLKKHPEQHVVIGNTDGRISWILTSLHSGETSSEQGAKIRKFIDRYMRRIISQYDEHKNKKAK